MLGILGLGSRSTLFYLKELTRVYNQASADGSTCPVKLLNADFNEINQLLPHTSAKLNVMVQTYLDELARMDVDNIIVPNITLHETIDRLTTGKKIIHPVYLTRSEIEKRKLRKVVLFGSMYTMQSNYIQGIFSASHIQVVQPANEEMLAIDHIRKQVYHETETSETLSRFNMLVKNYSQHCPVVLACTELSIASLFDEANVLDMARIQINTAINTLRS